MLVNIGSSKESSDVVGLLLACHERIRFFVDLARRLAEAQDASLEEVRAAAARVVRYFSESLPLHVEDEEESILPRLSGREPALDGALETMQREHQEHEPQLRLLVQLCQSIEAHPERFRESRESLKQVAADLERHFHAHLDVEERVVLPAINSLLTQQDRDTMLAELRARRSR